MGFCRPLIVPAASCPAAVRRRGPERGRPPQRVRFSQGGRSGSSQAKSALSPLSFHHAAQASWFLFGYPRFYWSGVSGESRRPAACRTSWACPRLLERLGEQVDQRRHRFLVVGPRRGWGDAERLRVGVTSGQLAHRRASCPSPPTRARAAARRRPPQGQPVFQRLEQTGSCRPRGQQVKGPLALGAQGFFALGVRQVGRGGASAAPSGGSTASMRGATAGSTRKGRCPARSARGAPWARRAISRSPSLGAASRTIGAAPLPAPSTPGSAGGLRTEPRRIRRPAS